MNDQLTTSAQIIFELAQKILLEYPTSGLHCHHWYLAILERNGMMVEGMVAGLSADAEKQQTLKKMKDGDFGKPLSEKELIQRAYDHAKKRGKLQAVERDLITIVISEMGLTLNEEKLDNFILTNQAHDAQTPQEDFLNKFGRNLTSEAKSGSLPEIVSRDAEIDLMTEILCRRTKRNPVLVGPAGVGKTAIVEGFAQKMSVGSIPDVLEGHEVIVLQPSLLTAGAQMQGEVEKRMQGILEEASRRKVILFVDEIHTIIGAGGRPGTTDIASILKPVLARGEIACIGATTDDEYRRFIEADSALERRFQPIRVQELSKERTYHVLESHQLVLQKRKNITVHDGVLNYLIQFADDFMRNRYFPDKAIDLLEQCYAFSIANNKDGLSINDAQHIAKRMVGMPLDVQDRILDLTDDLSARNVLDAYDIKALSNRLQVTMRGLDIHPNRSNACILLSKKAAKDAETIAASIARTLFGDADRVIYIDLARFLATHDISMLIGAPPGYVGYSDNLPLYRLKQTPWCVVIFDHIDACHPSIRDVIAQGLKNGALIDGQGKPIYFSDTVVIMTTNMDTQARKSSLGFMQEQPEEKTDDAQFDDIRRKLGMPLGNCVDLFFDRNEANEINPQGDLVNQKLMEITEKYKAFGLDIAWNPGFVNWLNTNEFVNNDRNWERWVDDVLCPELIPFLPDAGKRKEVPIEICVENDQIRIID
jgi:ATP-dependent Clp protease ATP-binding subunit ClpC